MHRNCKGFLRLFSFFALACLFAGSIAFGQTGTASLRGTVTDKSGATIAGAKVHLVNTAQALERDADTAAQRCRESVAKIKIQTEPQA